MTLDISHKDWWKEIDLKKLDSVDKCEEALEAFRGLLANMRTQVEKCKIQMAETGVPVDADHFHRVNIAFHYAKKKRNEITLRRDELQGFTKKQMQWDVIVKKQQWQADVLETLRRIEAKL